MIKYLDGMKETPDYRSDTHLVIYKNTLSENYPFHWHFAAELIMPMENSYGIVANDIEYTVHPGEIMFISPGVVHNTVAPSSGWRYIFQIDITRLKSINGITNILSHIGQIAVFNSENAGNILPELIVLFQDICDEYYSSEEFFIPNNHSVSISGDRNFLCEPIIYSKFLTMLTLIGRNYYDNIEDDSISTDKRQEYIGKFMGICSYIDEHFAEDLNLDDVASIAGFSKFHFSRLFKQYTNVSFYKYVNLQRISYAEQLLATPDISITEVAMKSGFSSSSAFIRMFKQIKNCTPSEFREIYESQSFDFKNETPTPIYAELARR